jgi:S-adenosyl-L-methionine hydrolase (adenosine-forming)
VPPFVTFISDFGAGDQYAGIVHGVISRVCPEAQVIHVSHEVEPQAVAMGARLLANAVPYLPVGVHLAVVDPGVGSERRALALRSGDGRLFVGPDNGLLVPAAEASGGIELAVQITEPRFMLEHVSHTFHGRDVFGPVAGHLAGGVDLLELGPTLDPDGLVRCAMPGFSRDGSVVVVDVQAIDRFGNVQLALGRDDADGLFEPRSWVELATVEDRYLALSVDTFTDAKLGELVLFEDSERRLAIAINRGDAAELLDVTAGQSIRLEFDPRIDSRL